MSYNISNSNYNQTTAGLYTSIYSNTLRAVYYFLMPLWVTETGACGRLAKFSNHFLNVSRPTDINHSYIILNDIPGNPTISVQVSRKMRVESTRTTVTTKGQKSKKVENAAISMLRARIRVLQ